MSGQLETSDISKLKINELKKILQDNNLPVSGFILLGIGFFMLSFLNHIQGYFFLGLFGGL